MQIILIPAHNASTWTGPTGNNTYLLPGRVPTLVDAGVGKEEHIAHLIRELDGAALAQVILTHGHSDHVAGVPALVERWPHLRVRQFGAGSEPISDGEVIGAGDGSLTTIHTPGHATDHCCFRNDGDVFCGDLARLGGTVVIPAGRGGDLVAYLRSLARIRDLHPLRLFPGHGPVIDDPEAVFVSYIRHRAQRDAQILEALEQGPSTPQQISARVYGTLAPELTRAAAETVLAHLIKLAAEGRVREHEGLWTRVP
jgi:hydroxyacylglutathione hydrolase